MAGGITARTTVCRTVDASTYGNGASDATAGIQAAIDACPPDRSSSCRRNPHHRHHRRLHPGQQGHHPPGALDLDRPACRRRTERSPAPTLPDPIPPLAFVGPARWDNGGGASTNLTSDAVKGAYSVNVASTAGFSAGQFVLLDELSNASWQTDPGGRGQPGPPRTSASSGNATTLLSPPTTPSPTPPAGSAARTAAERDQADRPRRRGHRLLHHHRCSYRAARTAQLSYFGYTFVQNAGIEDLKVTGGDDKAASTCIGRPTPGRRTSTTPPGSMRDFPWPTPSTWRSAIPTSTTPSGRSRVAGATPSASTTPPPRPWWRIASS